ncbi:MAG: hypothetical protein ACI4IG_00100 [Eubacterium sp.]
MKNKKLMAVQIIALILLVISVILNIFLPVHFYSQEKTYENKHFYVSDKVSNAGLCAGDVKIWNSLGRQPDSDYVERFEEDLERLESNRLQKREIYTKDELKWIDELDEIENNQKNIVTASSFYFEEKSEHWKNRGSIFERKRDSAKKAKIISLCVLTPITCVLIAGNLILILNCKKKKQDSI